MFLGSRVLFDRLNGRTKLPVVLRRGNGRHRVNCCHLILSVCRMSCLVNLRRFCGPGSKGKIISVYCLYKRTTALTGPNSITSHNGITGPGSITGPNSINCLEPSNKIRIIRISVVQIKLL